MPAAGAFLISKQTSNRDRIPCDVYDIINPRTQVAIVSTHVYPHVFNRTDPHPSMCRRMPGPASIAGLSLTQPHVVFKPRRFATVRRSHTGTLYRSCQSASLQSYLSNTLPIESDYNIRRWTLIDRRGSSKSIEALNDVTDDRRITTESK